MTKFNTLVCGAFFGLVALSGAAQAADLDDLPPRQAEPACIRSGPDGRAFGPGGELLLPTDRRLCAPARPTTFVKWFSFGLGAQEEFTKYKVAGKSFDSLRTSVYGQVGVEKKWLAFYARGGMSFEHDGQYGEMNVIDIPNCGGCGGGKSGYTQTTNPNLALSNRYFVEGEVKVKLGTHQAFGTTLQPYVSGLAGYEWAEATFTDTQTINDPKGKVLASNAVKEKVSLNQWYVGGKVGTKVGEHLDVYAGYKFGLGDPVAITAAGGQTVQGQHTFMGGANYSF